MIERTLVIGSTGFIGQHVLRHLHESGQRVIGMRRWHSSAESLHQLGVPDVVADLSDRQALVQAIGGFNHVIYCAAPDSELESDVYRDRAVTWIRNVLEIARDEDVERVVVTSTASTIASPPDGEDRLADERDVYLPGSSGDPFVEAAYAVEQECFRQAADGQSVLILNPTIVLGPGARLPSRASLEVDEDAPVNWVDIERVAEAHRAALEMRLQPSLAPGRRGNRYIIAGSNTTLEELYATIEMRPAVETFDATSYDSSTRAYRNRHLLTDGQWIDDSQSRAHLEI